jgi:hypothetical protein
MTREQIESLEAGKELDALVAEKVMGLNLVYVANSKDTLLDEEPYSAERTPEYSTDISAAMQVVEKIKGTPGEYEPFTMIDRGYWEVGYFSGGYEDYNGWSVRGDTLPLAICRSALIVAFINPPDRDS